MTNSTMNIDCIGIARVTRADGSVEQVDFTNIITDQGDIYYAQRGAAETPTETFDAMVVGTGAAATSKSDDYSAITTTTNGLRQVSGGFPATNDASSGNTGGGTDIVTWYAQWPGGVLTTSTTITEVGIIGYNGGAPAGSAPLLSRALLSSSLTISSASDVLEIFINHRMNGV